ncbi:MAG: cyclic peptide export ABC transporter [Bacteroidales bacterium]|nr:cyclic peptide export ABC transporter [Bacteroidales bacterium]
MTIFDFLKKENNKPLRKLLLLTALSGLASAGVLALINKAAQKAVENGVDIATLLLFAAVVGIFVTSQKFILTEGITMIEQVLHNVRIRLSDKIRKTDLLNIEVIGKAEIYNRLTQETTLISQMAAYLVTALQSAIMLVFILGYIAYLSLMAAVLLLVLITVGVVIFQKNNRKVLSELVETNKAEINYFEVLTDILDGLKEIKLNRKKSNDLFDDYGAVSQDVNRLKVKTGYLFSKNMVFSQAFIYIVLGAIVFVIPQLNKDFSTEIISTTTAMLFAIGPLTSLVSMIPPYEKVNLAVTNIYSLEDELDKRLNDAEVQPVNGDNRFDNFKNIDLDGLYFEYYNRENNESFSVGPVNLNIKRGEVIFLIGGNGSGKTTLLKALTMLYKPQSGKIYVDDKLIDDNNYLEYRELYSAIFYDFHLFSKLYGLEKISPKKVNELLKLMQLDKKTEFRDDHFSKLNLSTGQRKRLALIVTFLEDKPVYIFDEWAADQDPQFKNYFYEELLGKLKAQGKTVIAVSHDDRYYGLADRIIKMDYGKIV